MLFYWLLIVILKLSNVFADVEHRRVIRQDGLFYHFGHNCLLPRSSSCTNPDGQPGTCINIRNCQSLWELLSTRGREPSVATFLRRSQCGTENNYPKVCCPRGSSSTNTPAVRATEPLRTQSTTQSTTSDSTDYSQCGKSEKKATRIIAGQNATLGDWPWMVALGYRSGTKAGPDFKCGASLISNRWVVTAAHCVTNIGSLTLTTARVGDLDLSDSGNDNATPIDVPVEEVIVHPEYSGSPIVNDIALIRLRNPVTFTKLIRPICILSEAEHRSDGFYVKKLPFIIGWGATEWRGPTTNILQEAQIQIVDNEKCAQNYANRRSSLIDQRVLCAGKNGKDACQGDSGGPLILPIGLTYYLAGIVSYGIGCGDSNYPGVYTRVAQFSDWIAQNTRT